MGKIIQYDHTFGNGRTATVSVDEDLKGTHREKCLCFRDCVHFKPGTPENCEIAQSNFELCVKYDTVQPVFECPKYSSNLVDIAPAIS